MKAYGGGDHNGQSILVIMRKGNRRYSEVTVLGQSIGGEDDEADTQLKHTVKDKGAWFYRPLIRDEGHIDSTDMASRRAKKIITDGIMDSLTITARVRVRSDALQFDITTMLARRTFTCGREGKRHAEYPPC